MIAAPASPAAADVDLLASLEEEEGRLANAAKAARMAGVSVRTWRARLTLSDRTLVDFEVLIVMVLVSPIRI